MTIRRLTILVGDIKFYEITCKVENLRPVLDHKGSLWK